MHFFVAFILLKTWHISATLGNRNNHYVQIMLPVLTDVIPNAEKNCSSTPQLGKDSVEHSGYFYIQAASERGVFVFAIF